MPTSAGNDRPRAADVTVAKGRLVVELADGRSIAVPLGWFPRLAGATDVQRANWQLIGQGEGIHWPDVDEDIAVAGLLSAPRDAC